MLAELLELVRILSEVSDRSQQAGDEKRQRIAEYFENIAKCLRETVEELQQGGVPNAQWGELQSYVQHLPTTNIGQPAADQLSSLLSRLVTNLPTINDISSIENAAGTCRGLANIIKTNQSIVNPININPIPTNPTVTQDPGTTRREVIRKVITYTAFGAAGLVSGLLLDKAISSRQTNPGDDRLPLISWKMQTFLSDNVRKTILYDAPQLVCDRVRKMTQDRFNITLERTGETEEILTKVSAGIIECGYSGIYYNTPKYRALFFGCAIPFGLSPQEQTAWLHYKKNPNDELTFMQSIYKEKLGLNVIPFPAGATGGQMGGWFKAKINSLADLNDKNKIMRIPGLGAEVWQSLGITTHGLLGKPISVDEAIQRLKNGLFFAVEWTSPYDDIQLGLNKAAKFYYYPGWWEPSTTFDVQVNIDAWNKLPPHYREIFKLACHETYISILTEYDQKNRLVLKEIQNSTDIELVPFNKDVLNNAKQKTNDLLDLYAKQDNVFKEVYDEWRNFKETIRSWSNLTKIE
ncbi:TRAP transporter substrate-binding protein [Aerosakkonemataceae cyanobacterium BLCC-F50]|uniref:TRAP transporter substrate-binding protein n=1 Tax=Floridaenema flaviceps BLCC-F50 TaxID=3153642 RepID=A0ABV4XRT3_9CYAN